jgi:hypothetical protein
MKTKRPSTTHEQRLQDRAAAWETRVRRAGHGHARWQDKTGNVFEPGHPTVDPLCDEMRPEVMS